MKFEEKIIKLLEENNRIQRENQKVLKNAVNYLAFGAQVAKQQFNQIQALTKLVQDIRNEKSKKELEDIPTEG